MNFKYKYLKYKTKYTNLYNDLFGGSDNNIDFALGLANENFENPPESGSESDSVLDSVLDSGSEKTFESMCVDNVKGDFLKLNTDFQRSLSSNDLSDDDSFKNYRSKKNDSAEQYVKENHENDKHKENPLKVKDWNNRQNKLQSHLTDPNSKKRLKIITNRNSDEFSRKYYPIELNGKKC